MSPWSFNIREDQQVATDITPLFFHFDGDFSFSHSKHLSQKQEPLQYLSYSNLSMKNHNSDVDFISELVVILQQSYQVIWSRAMEAVQRNICGPYDKEFRKKFRGSITKSVSAQKMKLCKVPLQKQIRPRATSLNSHAMLPKLKQIERIAKMQRRKPQKLNKYLDGVSDLELYIANKLMNNQTTQQIVSQISKKSNQHLENRKIVTDNYLRMSLSGAQNTKFYRQSNELGPQSKTDYPGDNGRWLKMTSDQDFINKFDQFIVKKPQTEDQKALKQKKVHKDLTSQEEMSRQLALDKQKLTKIARKMIADHNTYTEQQDLHQQPNTYVNIQEENPSQQQKSIDWIINECKLYEKNYHTKPEKKGKIK